MNLENGILEKVVSKFFLKTILTSPN